MTSLILPGDASSSSPLTEVRSHQEVSDTDHKPGTVQDIIAVGWSPVDSVDVAIAVEEKVEESDLESVVVDVKAEGDGDKVCRICHISRDLDGGTAEPSELIQIGCGCKDDLGTAHRHCAEAWFRVKGNRYCEICGLNAQNLKGQANRRTSGDNRNSSETTSCSCGQALCNILINGLIVAIVLRWLSHGSLF